MYDARASTPKPGGSRKTDSMTPLEVEVDRESYLFPGGTSSGRSHETSFPYLHQLEFIASELHTVSQGLRRLEERQNRADRDREGLLVCQTMAETELVAVNSRLTGQLTSLQQGQDALTKRMDDGMASMLEQLKRMARPADAPARTEQEPPAKTVRERLVR